MFIDATNNRVGVGASTIRKFGVVDNISTDLGSSVPIAIFTSSTSQNNSIQIASELSGSTIIGINGSTANGELLSNSRYIGAPASGSNIQLIDGLNTTPKAFLTATSIGVGIGTINPSSKLHVVGSELLLGGPSTMLNTIANPRLRIHSNVNTDGSGGSIMFNEDSVNFGYYIQHNTGSGSTWGNDGLSFGAFGNITLNPGRPAFHLNGFNLIGIGTSNPQQKFHIDGSSDNNIGSTPTVAQVANDIVINSFGNLGIGILAPSHPIALASGAHVTTAGVWTNASDKRLKSNIVNSNYGLKRTFDVETCKI